MFELLKKLFGERSQTRLAGDTDAGLRQSEEQFVKLVSGVRDYAVFLLDHHGNVLTWNEGAQRIKGYSAEQIIGQHFSRFYTHESISSGWPAHELEVASATGRFEDEGWRIRRDGTRFWASVVITALRDDAGRVHGFLKITRDLTDRKQNEEKLRRSEERFRLLVEGVKDYAIFMLDPQGHVATWNSGAELLKGYQASEIIGQHFAVFYPAEVTARGWPEEELRRATAEGRIEDEGWRVRKDGSQFWASVVITALHDESGKLVGFAKVTRDLTERKHSEDSARRLAEEAAARRAAEQAAEEIERQREQLHVTLASIGDAVIVTDQAGVVTFLNPVAAALTGWTPEEASDRPLEDVFQIINEETRERFENPVERVFREDRIIELANHTALVGRDGREVPIEDSAAPVRHRDGTILGAVLVFRDVTESRRAAEDGRYLAAIVQSSDDAIIGQTLDGRIATWNRGAERLYGYQVEEILGESLAKLVPPDHTDELPAIIERVRRGEHIQHFETERVRKDGTRVDVSLTISPVRDAEGKVIGASKIARDITARKQEDRRKTEFLALLAHELRNPLAPLRSGVEVLNCGGDDPATRGEVCKIMGRQLDHLVRLVDDLLDVSRISQGKLQLRKERIELATEVNSALEICEQTVRSHGHELSVTLPEEPLYVDVDRTRLAQAVCNLLSNAAKYTDRGGRVSLAVAREGGLGVIRVKDTGIGISREMLPRIFEMFMQVDRSLEKSQGGLGVGLSIVKRVVEMHGGNVEARSEGEGRGSEFTIRLPLVESSAREGSEREPAMRRHEGSGRRILIVDDNRDSAKMLALLLKAFEYDVRIESDGEAGLATAELFLPEVILLDIGMPGLNGYDVARKVRETPWGESVMLVAVTGWGQEEDRQRSKAAGFNFHMVKPVDPSELTNLLAGIREN